MVLVGEVGLSGELRSTSHLDRRLGEAAKLGFRRSLCPSTSAEPKVDGLAVSAVRSVADAVDQALDGSRQAPPTQRNASAGSDWVEDVGSVDDDE
jgi:DNA repair protein RadA/Sms